MTLSSLWADLSPHLFNLLLGISLICLLTGIFISLRQTDGYRRRINLFSDAVTTRVRAPPASSAALPSRLTAAVFSPASMLSVLSGASCRVRPAILTPGTDASLLRVLFAALPSTHVMFTDRPLGEIVTATGALPPELRSSAGSALENVRAGVVIAEIQTLRPCGVILFHHENRDAFTGRILAAAGLPVHCLELGSSLRTEEAVEILHEKFGIPAGARAPVLAA